MNAFRTVAGLRTRSAEGIDDTAIRAFVETCPDAQLFHLPEWSRAVEAGCGQRGHYLIAESESGAIAGLLPLSEIRSRLFGSALVSAGFGVGGGAIGSREAVDALADAAVELAATLDCPTVELRGGAIPAGWRRIESVYAGFARDLPTDDEAILAAIPRKQRAEVRRALGYDLQTRIDRDIELHYRVYAESVRNLGTPVFPRALFRSMLEAFGDKADIVTVSRDGRPVASVLSFYFKGSVLPYWGGGTMEARSWRANELLYFELMRHAVRRGCTCFDFGRSKYGTGAFAFKKNWGFTPEPLSYSVHGHGRETNPLNPKYRLQVALWRNVPLWLANRIGPMIARGLG
ncbi:FemAB family XrtA/PEP-CTERM system-associated protein [Sphingosinicella rhizophila]|uniref:FemAB family PEP-CTERM system-associated protein n=1 Tax=Sphingosinicella rhizophila TaxID=3050082 RepID=A0ABU3Q2X5_9SPHN|nr:FemAB family XrtA/PEP-CTERM system-associated protein [Sphingosinicella sp. GR2756]MDT9597755.1 FemAB family PEP-CTERM system-associated protein [Sphingosinicella sp. GR2756]